MDISEIPIFPNKAYQEQLLTIDDDQYKITLTYNSVCQFWTLDMVNEKTNEGLIQGLSLVCGVPLLSGYGLPFEMVVTDETGENIDPILLGDLGGRNRLLLIREEV